MLTVTKDMSEITAYCTEDGVLAEHTTRRNDVEYFKCPACGAGGKARLGQNGGVEAIFDDEDDHTSLVFVLDEDLVPESVAEYEDDEDDEE